MVIDCSERREVADGVFKSEVITSTYRRPILHISLVR
jgi:hypothetical protein